MMNPSAVAIFGKQAPAAGGRLIRLLPREPGESVAEPEHLEELMILKGGPFPREVALVRLQDGAFRVNGQWLWPLVGGETWVFATGGLRPVWFRRNYEVRGNKEGSWTLAQIYFIGWEGRVFSPQDNRERDVRLLVGYCPQKKLIFFGS